MTSASAAHEDAESRRRPRRLARELADPALEVGARRAGIAHRKREPHSESHVVAHEHATAIGIDTLNTAHEEVGARAFARGVVRESDEDERLVREISRRGLQHVERGLAFERKHEPALKLGDGSERHQQPAGGRGSHDASVSAAEQHDTERTVRDLPGLRDRHDRQIAGASTAEQREVREPFDRRERHLTAEALGLGEHQRGSDRRARALEQHTT